MITVEDNICSQVKSLAMLTFSMMFGLCMFSLVSYLIINQIPLTFTDTTTATYIAGSAVILGVLILGAAKSFQKAQEDSIKQTLHEQKGLKKYRTTVIIFLIMMEAVGIIGIICFLLTGKALALLAPCMSIIQMFLHRPTIRKVTGLLG